MVPQESTKVMVHAEASSNSLQWRSSCWYVVTSVYFAFFAFKWSWQAFHLKILDIWSRRQSFAEFMVAYSEHFFWTSADLDGCWFRASDTNWEYYGSNADMLGKPGHSHWVDTELLLQPALALKLKKTSYWDITKDSVLPTILISVWVKDASGIEH